jgi:fructan beta-fructosidase
MLQRLSQLLLFACLTSAAFGQDQPNARLYRPGFHFSPQNNWINDPAGLVFDGSEYHLFNQYNPTGDEWGHMSWSHAVSKDLISWKELPLALKEENGMAIFTGSAVVDSENTSGFGGNGVVPMVAVYTGNSTGLQTQNVAYSTDHGITWTKYSGNPVIDLHESDFRDPMVFWHQPTKRWIMVVSLALKHKVVIFSSPDLKNWTKLSEFGPAGANAPPNWECPNLFELPVANVPGAKKWVLFVGVGDNGPAGGSATQYFVGDFDGKTFVNDNPSNQTLWVDYGSDFYAAQSWSNVRRVAIAWMNNWSYANKLPTSPWRGQLTLPRSLRLIKTGTGIRLKQDPVIELQALREDHLHRDHSTWQDIETLVAQRQWPETIEIDAVLECKECQEFGFVVRKGDGYGTRIGFDPAWNDVYVDRSHSGDLIIGPTFAARHEAPISIEDGQVHLHIFLDRSSVELFASDGLVTITDLIYPREEDRSIGVYGVGKPPSVLSIDLWTLKTRTR